MPGRKKSGKAKGLITVGVSSSSAARPATTMSICDSEPTPWPMWERHIPIFEVAFRQGMWWSISADLSQQIYDKYTNNEDVVYTWDWGNKRAGSYQANGQETSLNRYMIDFQLWQQRNLDNNRLRSVRLVWVTADSVDPQWTGEIL